MLDFTLFDKALKIVWVKRLCAHDERPWKFIPLSLLYNVGGSFLFKWVGKKSALKISRAFSTTKVTTW